MATSTAKNDLPLQNDFAERLNSQFNYLSFNAERHEYYDENGQLFDSVSSIIESFIAPFDVEKHSQKVALKENITAEEVKLKWQIRRDLSIVRGTEFHLYVDTYLSENRKIELQTNIANEVQSFHQFWDDNHQQKCEVVTTELKIADREWQIAGTLDCLVKANGNYYIFDWKTNKNIKMFNHFQKFLTPWDQLDCCEFNKYSLQASFYKLILERNTDLNIANCFLIHFVGSQYKVISCKDYAKLIEQFLANR